MARVLKAEIHANNIKHSEPTSQKTVTDSITKTNQLILFRKISAVYRENLKCKQERF